MGDRGGGLGFIAKPGPVGAGTAVRQQALQRDAAMQLVVEAEEHLPHAAAAQAADHFVLANARADWQFVGAIRLPVEVARHARDEVGIGLAVGEQAQGVADDRRIIAVLGDERLTLPWRTRHCVGDYAFQPIPGRGIHNVGFRFAGRLPDPNRTSVRGVQRLASSLHPSLELLGHRPQMQLELRLS